ncbi:unnamed protein product [Fraxinus pennsylvanica]|uniref:Uncharacterized protein n=1 Tax=Fraxinus pennsylvanica TaxID=56036 RepID=A0AAD2E2R9_9LAMI|nr:unnamed protein product [Fraxinus pennsylvanica]
MLKERSALITGQDIHAHEGAILTMKSNLDGQYLASAGKMVNHRADLPPLMVEKDKASKFTSLRKAPNSSCIVFPSKVFQILEKSLHVFQGHNGLWRDLGSFIVN